MPFVLAARIRLSLITSSTAATVASVLTGRNSVKQKRYTAGGMESRVAPASSATYFHQMGLIGNIGRVPPVRIMSTCSYQSHADQELCHPIESLRRHSATHDCELINSRKICTIAAKNPHIVIFRSHPGTSPGYPPCCGQPHGLPC